MYVVLRALCERRSSWLLLNDRAVLFSSNVLLYRVVVI